MTKFTEEERTEETKIVKRLYSDSLKDEKNYLSGKELFDATVIEVKKIMNRLK